jgi:sugar phosphate isomerase/epimerase
MTRREFFAAQAVAVKSTVTRQPSPKIAIFSKHLQWLDIPAMADAAKEVGFDAIDLTVRKGGHIEPENALSELPKAAKIIRSRGLEFPMITTAIESIETPHTEKILQAAAAAGIGYFRWGGLKYRSLPVTAQIQVYRGSAAKLAKLNAQYGVCGIYHTHSGINEFGASIWDIFEVVRGINVKHLAINYDIGHATVEGGFGGWINSARLCDAYLRGVAVKDFVWQKNEKGEWRPQWCPLGQGMVNLKAFFKLAHPDVIQLHFEYPMGGAEHGDRVITWSRDQVLSAMRRDLETLRGAFPA